MDPTQVEFGRWIYSAWKHLRTFRVDDAVRFEATGIAGKGADLLGRLRGLETYTPKHVRSLAQDVGITNRELQDTIVPRLEELGILQVTRDSAGRARELRAVVIGEDDVMAQVARLWMHLDPDASERGALCLLGKVASLPCTEDEALAACTDEGLAEEEARLALELAEGHALVMRRHVSDFNCDFLYNDFLWGENIDQTAEALAGLPVDVRAGIRSLLEELHQNEGRPLKDIESVSPDLVELAVRHGIVERTEIVTKNGRKGTFHFTPRFQGFGVARRDMPDVLDQVRLVIASFTFATRYAQYKLRDPEVFLQALIDRGEAGNATVIATDYGALQKQDIVGVVPVKDGSRYHRFVARKKDALIAALDTMRAGSLQHPTKGSGSGAGLLQPRGFSDPVATRLRLGKEATDMPLYEEELLAAFRDAAQQDKFR